MKPLKEYKNLHDSYKRGFPVIPFLNKYDIKKPSLLMANSYKNTLQTKKRHKYITIYYF